jgi:hypothetical protein
VRSEEGRVRREEGRGKSEEQVVVRLAPGVKQQ